MPIPFVPQDLYSLVSAEDPRLSPDGRWIAFVRVDLDRPKNAYRRSIWLVPTSGDAPPRRFTSGTRDLAPRWSPDGKFLAFLSAREGKPQVYLIELAGGEALRLTDLPHGASDPDWSPDGKWLAFLSRTNRAERELEDRGEFPPLDPAQRSRFLEEIAESDKKKTDPRVITRLPYRTGTEYSDDRSAHLYVIKPDEGAIPRRVTSGDWNFDPPAWSPDGRYLYTAASPDPSADENYLEHEMVRVRIRDGRLHWLADPGFACFTPLPSPDGKWLAYFRIDRANPATELTDLVLRPLRGRRIRSLTRPLDRACETARWSPDSQALYFPIPDRGNEGLYRAVPGGGEPEQIVDGPRRVLGFDPGVERVVLLAGSAQFPTDLFLVESDGRAEKRLTHLNDELIRAHAVAAHQELWYDAPDGRRIQGWLLCPPGFDPRKKYPLLIEIHGGPHLMWGPGTHTMWFEYQVMVGRGYCVFYCNPRGSDGYGREFMGAIRGQWGEAEAPDILAGVDALLARGFIDPKKLAITGGSYGGYMTVWIIGHDRRFCCAFAQRGVYNLLSFHGTTDHAWYWDHELGGAPWETFENHWKHSPLAYVNQIRTPLAIKHSDQDYRAPISDAEQLFVALRRLGRPVQFLRYPRDGHELSRAGEPDHRVDRLERMLAWFDKYCRPASRKRAPNKKTHPVRRR